MPNKAAPRYLRMARRHKFMLTKPVRIQTSVMPGSTAGHSID
jgi:hypothetical protein